MTPEAITSAITTLEQSYGSEHVRVAREGARTLVRIDAVELYPTCKPAATPMLLALDSGGPKPLVYVAPGQLLVNGRPPKNSSVVQVGGEPWMQFSFNIPWEERHGILRFLAAARQRFAQDV